MNLPDLSSQSLMQLKHSLQALDLNLLHVSLYDRHTRDAYQNIIRHYELEIMSRESELDKRSAA